MRSLFIAFTLLAALPRLAPAQEAIPERLSKMEYQDGWLRLFDGATTFGWQSGGAGDWKVENGALTSPDSGESMISSASQFADFEMNIAVESDNGIHYFFSDAANDEDNKPKLTNIDAAMWGPNDPKIIPHLITIRAIGTQMVISRDGKSPRKFKRKNLRSAIVFRVDHPRGVSGTTRIRSVKLRPLNLPSIFNGKDLMGWKPLPGHKSVFSVTRDGWLNIKNGNGDIETQASYSDFTLQMDVYSNGDHLNSGIFFREKPGEFWNGYECQIRNQWEGKDRTKPVDIGTGGLYFRQPARKVVSSDREWFTMTINAVGRHIAIWTDGYQTADFQDTRPAGDGMARDNFRATGVFGLQGHDPTTDLSFRNIKVGELPALR